MRHFSVMIAAVVGLVLSAAGGRGNGEPIVQVRRSESSVAMVQSVRGEVNLVRRDGTTRRPARGTDVYVGDRIEVPQNAAVLMIYFHDSHVERIKAGNTVTVTKSAATPPEAVERTEPYRGKSVAGSLPKLGISRGAVYVFRSDEPDTVIPPAITPIWDSTLLGDRPAFAWPADPSATQYEVRLWIDGSRKVLWTRVTNAPGLEFPNDEPALERGPTKQYMWTVRTITNDAGAPRERGKESREIRGQFKGASPTRSAQLAELRPLVESNEPDNLLVAGSVLEAERIYDQALDVFKRLTQLDSSSPDLHLRLAELRYRAGQAAEFLAELGAAKKLGIDPPEILRTRAERLRESIGADKKP